MRLSVLEDFQDGHASAALPGHELLRNYVAQSLGQTAAQRGLLRRRKCRHDALQSLRRIGGVQAGKHQVASLGGFENHLHGFAVAHFAHQDHLGRLPQGGAQRQREVRRIAVQFPLVDGGPLVIVQKLDGIFDGDDVAGLLFVDAVEQRRQGGRLSRPARSRNQNNAIAEVCDFPELQRKSQSGELGNRGRNHAHDHRAAAALDENIHPKAGQPGNPKEISQEPCSRSMLMACLLSPMRSEAMRRVSSAREQPQSRPLHRNQLSIDFHLRRTAGRENQVAHLFSGAQHGRQQGMRGRRSGMRCRLERDLQRGCAW